MVNIARLNAATRLSIDNQLVTSARNGLVYKLDSDEEFEPGRAMYGTVYKDLLANKKTFMRSELKLTPGLVVFSILNAVNKERLRISRKPNDENDFEIVQKKALI